MARKIVKSDKNILAKSYQSFLSEIKEKIMRSQIKAVLAANQKLIRLYWEIGRSIDKKQKEEKWGAKVIAKIAKDLKSTFPSMKGFSRTNINYMAQFAREYPNFKIVQQPVGQIPWGHNILLLQKLNTQKERVWYAQKTIENGWSRSVLLHWIDSNLYKRHGKIVSNFPSTLPATRSDLAQQTLKDPYCFDFLSLREKFNEKELENGLLDHIQKFLLELGAGFSFVGRQVQLSIDNQEFYIDLLFYHLRLRSFIVVELKATEFKPDYAGKLNFYLTAVDETLKHPDDQATIGLLLCKTKNKMIAEYALRGINTPIGVSEYETKIVESLPKNLKGSLPTIEELELEFE